MIKSPKRIVLSTLNARYNHASLGLRYLRANLGIYREQTQIHEMTIKQDPLTMANDILEFEPEVVGFGIYIWNTTQTARVILELRRLRPQLIIVVGGPEISFETEAQALFDQVDFVFQGEADFAFRDFVTRWIETRELPLKKIIPQALPDIRSVVLPYQEYTAEDIRQRTLYVEASRGCPYKCEYCLSALDTSVRNFNLQQFLTEMQLLLDRGARQFKFVDRTFNLAPTISRRILEFFLTNIDLGLFLHFEMVPDRLPEELRVLIQQFPQGSLQFEIGIQTWNPEVARNVSRRQNYERITENLEFLRDHTGVHTHADLIVGLPGETSESFAKGFNALYELGPDEIQVGILKRLKGTPIIRHDTQFKMVYATDPPFQILENKDLSASEISRLKVFADFWGHLINSGRFPGLKPLVKSLGVPPFEFFIDLTDALFTNFGRTHSIHLVDLESALKNYLNKNSLPTEAGKARTLMKNQATATPQRQALHQLAL